MLIEDNNKGKAMLIGASKGTSHCVVALKGKLIGLNPATHTT